MTRTLRPLAALAMAAVVAVISGLWRHRQQRRSLSAKGTPEQQSAALKVAQCIPENGVKDFPDPVLGEPLVDTTKIPSSATPVV